MAGIWTGVSPGVLASFSQSLRQVVSSSLSQLWLLKQFTLHRMGYLANGYELQGIFCFYRGQRSQLLMSSATLPLKLFSVSFSPSCVRAFLLSFKETSCLFRSRIDSNNLFISLVLFLSLLCLHPAFTFTCMPFISGVGRILETKAKPHDDLRF